jgi:hypothetical protein
MSLVGVWGRARLGLVAGAFFVGVTAVAAAQVVQPPPSVVPIPPKQKTDSTTPKPDTIKPRVGRSTDPGTTDIGPQYSWNREELFASGALTLADLLERVPGATSFRTGWLTSPKFIAINGNLNAVRIFYDGIELDNLNARTAPLIDLTSIQLWTLENVSVERQGGELQVHLRSWQAERTDPYTRTDLSTGNEDTNLYRGFYGKRFSNGGVLQLAGQQFSTTSVRLGGGGDELAFLGRVGFGGKKWSLDAFANRSLPTRVIQPTFGTGMSVPPFAATQTLAYIRGAVGRIHDGPWLELIASTSRLQEDSRHITALSAPSLRVSADTTDTTTNLQQYVLSAGYTRGPIDFSGLDRVRSTAGATTHSPSARFQFDSQYLLVNLFAEHDDFAKRVRSDAQARFTPLPFIAVSGAITRVGTTVTTVDPANQPDVLSARIEGGIRIWRPWLIAGFLTRDTALIEPIRGIDTAYVPVFTGRRSGSYVGLRGNVIGALGADIVVTQWASADAYRPKYQARSELNFITRWLSRFPSGNFGIHAAFVHDYRGQVIFPVIGGVRTTAASNVFTGLLEIRILRGVLSYQIRNTANELYQLVPDFYMPRVVNLYGVRWEFYN